MRLSGFAVAAEQIQGVTIAVAARVVAGNFVD